MTVDTARWRLTLYVRGASPQSAAAVETVRRICDEDLLGRVDLRIMDIRDAGAEAVDDEILVVPTLVKLLPGPRRKIVGDLSDVRWVRTALDVHPAVDQEFESDEP